MHRAAFLVIGYWLIVLRLCSPCPDRIHTAANALRSLSPSAVPVAGAADDARDHERGPGPVDGRAEPGGRRPGTLAMNGRPLPVALAGGRRRGRAFGLVNGLLRGELAARRSWPAPDIGHCSRGLR